jgi:hypothetical protein
MRSSPTAQRPRAVLAIGRGVHIGVASRMLLSVMNDSGLAATERPCDVVRGARVKPTKNCAIGAETIVSMLQSAAHFVALPTLSVNAVAKRVSLLLQASRARHSHPRGKTPQDAREKVRSSTLPDCAVEFTFPSQAQVNQVRASSGSSGAVRGATRHDV